jgi:hypothetical protein
MSSCCKKIVENTKRVVVKMKNQNFVEIQGIPSGQIRAAREWYHWIRLEKDINRNRFLIF